MPRVPAKVFLLNRQPALSLSGGNGSWCPRLCENSPFNLRVESSSHLVNLKTKKFSRRLFEESNRENCSTLSWLANVFTRPGPIAVVQFRLEDRLNFGGNLSFAPVIGRETAANC